MKLKKVLGAILVVALLLAFASPTFAYTETRIISSSSTNGHFVEDNVARSYSSYSLSNATITTSSSATKLTVRPYKTDQTTKVANATTYKSGSLTGGKPYWSGAPSSIAIKCNSDANDTVAIYGLWKF